MRSLDDLAADVTRQRVVQVSRVELLAAINRRRMTAAAINALADELEARQLELSPDIMSGAGPFRVFRRDSAVAALLDAVASPTAEAEAVLATYGTRASGDRVVVRNLAELLAWGEVDTLEHLAQSYPDVDPDLWITFPNEDQYTQAADPDRMSGVVVRTDDANLYLQYPFDPQQLSNDVQTLDELFLFKVELDEFCPGAEFGPYLASLVEDRLIAPYVDSELRFPFTTRVLALVEDRGSTARLVAVYQRRGTVRFDLRPADVPRLLRAGDIWATSDHPKAARVICRADDETLVYEVLLEALAMGGG